MLLVPRTLDTTFPVGQQISPIYTISFTKSDKSSEQLNTSPFLFNENEKSLQQQTTSNLNRHYYKCRVAVAFLLCFSGRIVYTVSMFNVGNPWSTVIDSITAKTRTLHPDKTRKFQKNMHNFYVERIAIMDETFLRMWQNIQGLFDNTRGGVG